MRTLKLTLAYDGTAYVGWQRQPNGVSIQQLIEEALGAFAPHEPLPVVNGASRTDAGVHALAQVASARVAFPHPVDAVQRALNVRLPGDIRVLSVEDVAAHFHARIDARGKSYRYRIATDPVVMPADRWFVWHVPQVCDVDRMRDAARHLVGAHDFAAFQASGSDVIGTRRVVHRLELDQQRGELHLTIDGDGFLRHMVRIVTGSLVDVGVGTHPPAWMADVVASRDRRRAGRTAPAAGLVLERVYYDAPWPS